MATSEKVCVISDLVDRCLNDDDNDDDDALKKIKQEISNTPGNVYYNEIDLGEVKQEYPDHQRATTCSLNDLVIDEGASRCEDLDLDSVKPLRKRPKLTSAPEETQIPCDRPDETPCFEVNLEHNDDVDPLQVLHPDDDSFISIGRVSSIAGSAGNIGDQTADSSLLTQLLCSGPIVKPTPLPEATNLLSDSQTCCVVQKLISYGFSSSFWTVEEIIAILKKGRPKVLVFELKSYSSYYYKKYPWLAACNRQKRFYCWPCLLFAGTTDWWMSCESISVFATNVNLHECTPEHQKNLDLQQCWERNGGTSLNQALLASNPSNRPRSRAEKDKIILQGRACPILSQITNSQSARTKQDEKSFYESLYNEFKWLTGCTTDGKLYCWPCVLFGQSWAFLGKQVNRVANLKAALRKHESTCSHMGNNVKLKNREFSLKSKTINKCIPEFTVAKHRSFVKFLTEVICIENKRLTNTQVTWKDWAASLELLAAYNVRLAHFLQEKTKSKGADFVKKVIEVLGRLVLDSIEHVMQERIKREVESAPFVTIILDQILGGAEEKCQAVVVRYVDHNAKVIERFFKFIYVKNSPLDFMGNFVINLAEDLNCESKLVGFTYDGFLVPPKSMGSFNEDVKQNCPSASFFHYKEHPFSRILKQTLCSMTDCRHLFTVITELSVFFENSSTGASIDDKTHPSYQAEWDTKREFVVTLMKCYNPILAFFKRISENPSKENVAAVIQAWHFYDFLNQPVNRILVSLIGRLFQNIELIDRTFAIDGNTAALKEQATTYKMAMNQIKSTLDLMVAEAYKMSAATNNATNSLDNDVVLKEKCCLYIQLAEDMVLHRLQQLENSCFMVLSDPIKSEQLRRSIVLNFKNPVKILTFKGLPRHFNEKKLLSELSFSGRNALLRTRDFDVLVQTISDYDLSSTVPELYKLLQLALVIPMPSVKSTSTPLVNEVREYVRKQKGFTSANGLIWLERDLLTSCQSDPQFYEEIIDRVAEVAHTEEFPLKTSGSGFSFQCLLQLLS